MNKFNKSVHNFYSEAKIFLEEISNLNKWKIIPFLWMVKIKFSEIDLEIQCNLT